MQNKRQVRAGVYEVPDTVVLEHFHSVTEFTGPKLQGKCLNATD